MIISVLPSLEKYRQINKTNFKLLSWFKIKQIKGTCDKMDKRNAESISNLE